MSETDEEDIIECDCYMIFCISKDGKIYTDRVYRDASVAEKRIRYLNTSSGERGHWTAIFSQLGK